MERNDVDSSALKSVGYDPATHILEVEFRNGRIYAYSGVPTVIYDRLMSAESKGQYMNAEIRSAYPYVQVR